MIDPKDPAWRAWWALAVDTKGRSPGALASSGEWAWGLSQFGREAQVRVCLAAAEWAVELCPVDGETAGMVADLSRRAMGLARRWLVDHGPSGLDADIEACEAGLVALHRRCWFLADEYGGDAEEVAKAAGVFLALARALAWTPERARAEAIAGDEEDAVAVGPAIECANAMSALLALNGGDFAMVREGLLKRVTG